MSIKVFDINLNTQGEHNIMFLSDRWGNLPDDEAIAAYGAMGHDAEKMKVQIERLQGDLALLESLQDQLHGELGFIASMDDKMGVLFEIEFRTLESDGGENKGPAFVSHECVSNKITSWILGVLPKYQDVKFMIPDVRYVFEERAAIWAFAESGSLSKDRCEELCDILLALTH